MQIEVELCMSVFCENNTDCICCEELDTSDEYEKVSMTDVMTDVQQADNTELNESVISLPQDDDDDDVDESSSVDNSASVLPASLGESWYMLLLQYIDAVGWVF